MSFGGYTKITLVWLSMILTPPTFQIANICQTMLQKESSLQWIGLCLFREILWPICKQLVAIAPCSTLCSRYNSRHTVSRSNKTDGYEYKKNHIRTIHSTANDDIETHGHEIYDGLDYLQYYKLGILIKTYSTTDFNTQKKWKWFGHILFPT